MLQLYAYQDALTHVQVIHKSCMEFYTQIRLPAELSQKLSLCGVYDLGESDEPVEIQYTADDISRDCMHPWLRVATSWLNTNIGYHLYKFSFVHIGTDEVMSLYLAYRIQGVPSEKSYIYMNREEN